MPELETLKHITDLIPDTITDVVQAGKALDKIKEYIKLRIQDINDELEETFKTINEE